MMFKSCTICKKTKEAEHFPPNMRHKDGRGSWCHTCVRIQVATYRRTERYRNAITAYQQRPDVKRRKRLAEEKRQRKPDYKVKRKLQRQTFRSRVLHCRRQARLRMKQATTRQRRAALTELIKQYDAELRRINRSMAGN